VLPYNRSNIQSLTQREAPLKKKAVQKYGGFRSASGLDLSRSILWDRARPAVPNERPSLLTVCRHARGLSLSPCGAVSRKYSLPGTIVAVAGDASEDAGRSRRWENAASGQRRKRGPYHVVWAPGCYQTDPTCYPSATRTTRRSAPLQRSAYCWQSLRPGQPGTGSGNSCMPPRCRTRSVSHSW